ncbi:XdhC family protein [Flagellimonas algicola]|uniref:XdhC family protein n=1 Tax=Flagellimonas algicola TaxID=2583815 RepID=A0ABY2WP64_9FLAO|nr:XdhC/CoxI family protein [Allomuricauda algicola]TMU56451.1 XdhC family protein [Allomuricauda algicola]
MTHELKHIVQEFEEKRKLGRKSVLATVVALDGSSYRRPGVRMLIFENGDMVGAVSGGCVEKEVLRQAESVFTTAVSKVMVYDGRYRLGCEGILYLLLEEFDPETAFLEQFWDTIKTRRSFSISSYFDKEPGENPNYGTLFHFHEGTNPINNTEALKNKGLLQFEQEMHPCFQLVIIGAEHDAVQLCKYAATTGWEVTVVANPREEKSEKDFPGIQQLISVEPELYQPNLDNQTAVVVMTHSYVKDLQFLMALREQKGIYIGLLGPFRRREKLFDELMERCPDVSEEFLESVHGPAGIDIGAETPQEIAISVVSEILTVVRGKEPALLKHKMGRIHT